MCKQRLSIPQGYIDWVITEHNCAYVYFIEIYPEYQRHGYGTTLLKTLCSKLYKQRIRYIELDDVLGKDNQFYTRLGFEYKISYDNTMQAKISNVIRSNC